MSNTTSIGLGTYVRDQHGHEGRVHNLHWSCPESATWRAGQSIPVTEEQEREHWASLLVHNGGAVVQPLSTLTIIEPFDLTNTWADFYWPEAVTCR